MFDDFDLMETCEEYYEEEYTEEEEWASESPLLFLWENKSKNSKTAGGTV